MLAENPIRSIGSKQKSQKEASTTLEVITDPLIVAKEELKQEKGAPAASPESWTKK